MILIQLVALLLYAVDGQPLIFFVEATIYVFVVIMIGMVIVPVPVTATVYGGHGTKHAGDGAYHFRGVVMRILGMTQLLQMATKLALFPL
jgi:hypothetical protein